MTDETTRHQLTPEQRRIIISAAILPIGMLIFRKQRRRDPWWIRLLAIIGEIVSACWGVVVGILPAVSFGLGIVGGLLLAKYGIHL